MTDVLQRFSSDAPPGHPNRPPKDASTLILLDRSAPSPKVLMGKRHDGHVFPPGKVGPEAELLDLVWLPLDGIRERIGLLAITDIVLADLDKLIKEGFSHDLPVPFYRVRSGKRVREFL